MNEEDKHEILCANLVWFAWIMVWFVAALLIAVSYSSGCE